MNSFILGELYVHLWEIIGLHALIILLWAVDPSLVINNTQKGIRETGQICTQLLEKNNIFDDELISASLRFFFFFNHLFCYLVLFKLVEWSVTVINLKRSSKIDFQAAMWRNLVESSLNDILGDEDTAAALSSDPRNALYALITPDSTQTSFPELKAHVPAENTPGLRTTKHRDFRKWDLTLTPTAPFVTYTSDMRG